MKAFVINVVGDIGLVLAAFLIFRELGSFDYGTSSRKRRRSSAPTSGRSPRSACCSCVGAFAKSAQLPLHTWLPDAMEGPTPVSSLIHAATMVTAGVYLIARTHVLFVLAPTAADIAAFVGLATLLVAATIALVMTDLKRAIAYSTMSQIGYMIMGVSIGAYSAGMFHLMTHAFFKALLFMAAGSIIAAMANDQNIDRMSGFGKAMRFTSFTFVCGALALAAFPGTSGFFSKDEILAFAEARGGMYVIFTVLGYLGALMTAVYSFRLDLPGPARRAMRRGAGADRDRPRRPRGADEPGDGRARGHRRRLPGPRAPHRRAVGADAGGDGRPRLRRDLRRPGPDPGGRRRRHQVPRPGLGGLAAGGDRALAGPGLPRPRRSAA